MFYDHIWSIFFSLLGLSTYLFQNTCDDELWSSCAVKVPLCQFKISCNCAGRIIHKHNMTHFPSSIESMTAMKKLQINNGPLKKLPENIGTFMPGLSVQMQISMF